MVMGWVLQAWEPPSLRLLSDSDSPSPSSRPRASLLQGDAKKITKHHSIIHAYSHHHGSIINSIPFPISLSPSLMAPTSSTSSSSSSGFFAICLVHSAVAITCGALMMFYLNEISAFGHGAETARKLLGSTPHDQLLIQTSDSFAGLLLFALGFLLFMVSFVKDRDFQAFFAKGCVLLHAAMALWRFYFERRLEDLAGDWPRQVVGDVMLALSWVLFLVYSWREKYD